MSTLAMNIHLENKAEVDVIPSPPSPPSPPSHPPISFPPHFPLSSSTQIQVIAYHVPIVHITKLFIR